MTDHDHRAAPAVHRRHDRRSMTAFDAELSRRIRRAGLLDRRLTYYGLKSGSPARPTVVD
jgi:hypothetical protein